MSAAAPAVLDLTAGATGSFGGPINVLESLGARTYFYGGIGGNKLYVTDATLGGTKVVDDLAYMRNLALLGAFEHGPLYVIDDVLYVYDGARTSLTTFAAGTTPRFVGQTDSKLAFVAATVSFKIKLYVTDGTAANTRDLGIRDASSTSSPAVLGNFVYVVDNSGAVEKTDGVTFSSALGGWSGAAPLEKPVVCGGKLYVSTTDGLAVTDGTATPTTLVGSLSHAATQLVCAGTKVFFLGTQSASGAEPWVSDGTASGTKLVRDVRPGSTGITSISGAAGDGRIYFLADDGTHGRELWTSDGTEAGTVLVEDLTKGAGDSSFSFLSDTLIDGHAVFAFYSKLYVTDGAKLLDRTAALGAISLPDAGSSSAARVGTSVVYAGGTPATGRELVVLDSASLVPEPVPDAGIDTGTDAADSAIDSEVADSAATDSASADTAVEDAAPAAEAPPSADDSCSCSLPGARGSRTEDGVAALAILALMVSRRRRRVGSWRKRWRASPSC